LRSCRGRLRGCPGKILRRQDAGSRLPRCVPPPGLTVWAFSLRTSSLGIHAFRGPRQRRGYAGHPRDGPPGPAARGRARRIQFVSARPRLAGLCRSSSAGAADRPHFATTVKLPDSQHILRPKSMLGNGRGSFEGDFDGCRFPAETASTGPGSSSSGRRGRHIWHRPEWVMLQPLGETLLQICCRWRDR